MIVASDELPKRFEIHLLTQLVPRKVEDLDCSVLLKPFYYFLHGMAIEIVPANVELNQVRS